MARWAGLEPAPDGLENRCSIRLSYHRLKPVADGISSPLFSDKGKAHEVDIPLPLARKRASSNCSDPSFPFQQLRRSRTEHIMFANLWAFTFALSKSSDLSSGVPRRR